MNRSMIINSISLLASYCFGWEDAILNADHVGKEDIESSRYISRPFNQLSVMFSGNKLFHRMISLHYLTRNAMVRSAFIKKHNIVSFR